MSIPACRFRRFMLLSGLLLLPALAASRANGEDLANQFYEKAKAASVEILVNGHLNGSGWIADPQGLVMTAGHVVENPDRKLEITFALAGPQRREARGGRPGP